MHNVSLTFKIQSEILQVFKFCCYISIPIGTTFLVARDPEVLEKVIKNVRFGHPYKSSSLCGEGLECPEMLASWIRDQGMSMDDVITYHMTQSKLCQPNDS